MIFIDSNIVIDLIETSGRWSSWSREAAGKAIAEGPVLANIVVMAECAPRFESVDEELSYFDLVGIKVAEIPAAAAFRAGRAHRDYRRAGGERTSLVADFLIGAHASALGARLLTRDRQRFSSYFPELNLITPESDNG
ncbi:MAG: PIN domain-containing protein [Pseudomonadota bacterium]